MYCPPRLMCVFLTTLAKMHVKFPRVQQPVLFSTTEPDPWLNMWCEWILQKLLCLLKARYTYRQTEKRSQIAELTT